MNITLACAASTASLYDLWRTSFHDEDETIDLFFKFSFAPQNTVVCFDGEQLASMLFLLPEQIRIGKQVFSAYYVYAAATARAYRNRGIMSEMLNFSRQLCAARKVDFLFLVPADAHLFSYYGKRGFVTAFRQVLRSSPCGAPNAAVRAAEPLPDRSAAAVREQRLSALRAYDFVQWRDNEISLFQAFLTLAGGKSAVFDGGYFAAEPLEDAVQVYELCASDQSLAAGLALLRQTVTAEQYTLHLPVGHPLADGGTLKDVGMLCPVSAAAKSLGDLTALSIYMGITLQ